MSEIIKYFAYGSNLLPLRLLQRVASSKALGHASLSGYQLRFHKKGQDGSGKCNVFYTGETRHQVIGVVYEMYADERILLDAAENLGKGYELVHHQVQVQADNHQVFLYVAPPDYIDDSLLPYSWYRDLVVQGARAHGLPGDYIEAFLEVPSNLDPDVDRHTLHQRILSNDR
jgi:gamma-glutamylcyclotransferase (GGCT)/AIG2-like uncharacterized protein YtfP